MIRIRDVVGAMAGLDGGGSEVPSVAVGVNGYLKTRMVAVNRGSRLRNWVMNLMVETR